MLHTAMYSSNSMITISMYVEQLTNAYTAVGTNCCSMQFSYLLNFYYLPLIIYVLGLR